VLHPLKEEQSPNPGRFKIAIRIASAGKPPDTGSLRDLLRAIPRNGSSETVYFELFTLGWLLNERGVQARGLGQLLLGQLCVHAQFADSSTEGSGDFEVLGTVTRRHDE
jgi:hypothetical protein